MDRKDDNGVVSRKAVADRLRIFFAAWTAQLASGVAEIWGKVEQRLSEKSAGSQSGGQISGGQVGVTRMPMQQQPIQQQQSKAEPQDEK